MILAPLANAAPELAAPGILLKAQQLILVVADSWETNTAELQLFSRANEGGQWQQTTGPWQVMMGKNGLAWAADFPADKWPGPVKKEGDGKSPAGVFTLGSVFGFASVADPDLKLDYFPVTKTTLCIDDPESQFYGQMLDTSQRSEKDWRSQEIMYKYPQQYQLGIIVNYNVQGQVKQGGSCIFLHVKGSNSKGTAGCTAMTVPQIKQLTLWLNPDDHPVLVQLPKEQYHRLKTIWNLP